MGKSVKADKQKAITQLKIFLGVALGLGFWFLGDFLLRRPADFHAAVPLGDGGIYYASLFLELALLGVFDFLLLRDRVGMATWWGAFLFSSVGYSFSAANGMLLQEGNAVFYLIPLMALAVRARVRLLLPFVLLALLPEALVFGYAHLASDGAVLPPVPGGVVDWEAVAAVLPRIVFTILAPALVVSLLRYTVITPVRSSTVAAMSRQSANQTVTASPMAKPTGTLEAVSAKSPEPVVQVSAMTTPKALSVGNVEEVEDLKGLLESIVFFMSKNFKAHSALGFLSVDDGRTFVLNARFTRSKAIREDILVHPSSGLVGKAIREPNGFMTGNANTYPDNIEYYNRREEVNSIMVSRIVDETTQKVIGLLVVDNTALRAFDDTDKELLTRFSVVASKLVSNAKLTRAMAKAAQQSEIVYGISKQLAAENFMRGILGVLIENLRKVFDADRLVLCDFVAETGMGRILRYTGEDLDVPEKTQFRLDDPNCIYGQVFATRTECLASDFTKEGQYRFIAEEDKDKQPVEIMVVPLLDDQQHIVAVIGLESMRPGVFQRRTLVLLQTIMANATSALTRAKLFGNLQQQATVDGLTRIPNHRHFQDVLDQSLKRAKEKPYPVTLLLMDIDHFKKFNDTYGHPVGDLVLQNVAAAVSRTIRKQDFAARYGGEEFTVILNGIGRDGCITAAERIREAVQTMKVHVEGKPLSITVSIGCATFPDDGSEKKTIIDKADQSMYHSKENGRNRVTAWYQVDNGAAKSS